MITKQTLYTIIRVLLFLAITYLILFNHLDREVFRLWDESRVVMNTLEMMDNKNYIVLHFNSQPDMWNTKPPLLHWIQLLFIKLIGFNEVAFRLPSAIAGLMTCGLLLWFSWKYLKSYWLGIFSVLILITSKGFIGVHTVRYCEYDSLLTFFTTLYTLSFFLYIELTDKKHKQRYLNLTFVGLTLAVLTKGIAGLLLTPGLLLYMLVRKQILPTLKNKQSYINLGLFALFTLGYYFLRELYNPGYIETVWINEIGGRYMEEKSPSNPWFYYNYLINTNFSFWYICFLFGTALGLLWKDLFVNKFIGYSFTVSFLFFIIVSNAKTQNTWYTMPMYPLISLIAAFAVFYLFKIINETQLFRWNNITTKVLSVIVIGLIFWKPYTTAVSEVTYMADRHDEQKFDISYYLRKGVHREKDLNGYHLVQKVVYQPHPLIYVKLLEARGEVIHRTNYKELKAGYTIMVHQEKLKNYIHEHYEYRDIDGFKSARVYEILGVKN